LKDNSFGETAARLEEGISVLEETSQHIAAALGSNSTNAHAGATPYLRIFGLVAGASYLAEAALAASALRAGGETDPAHLARIETARFFAENLLPASSGLEAVVVSGAESVLNSETALAM
jgi:butyryl-CoA dehydrogenase